MIITVPVHNINPPNIHIHKAIVLPNFYLIFIRFFNGWLFQQNCNIIVTFIIGLKITQIYGMTCHIWRMNIESGCLILLVMQEVQATWYTERLVFFKAKLCHVKKCPNFKILRHVFFFFLIMRDTHCSMLQVKSF